MVTPMKPETFSESCVNAAKGRRWVPGIQDEEADGGVPPFRKRLGSLTATMTAHQPDREAGRNGGPPVRIRMLIRVRKRWTNRCSRREGTTPARIRSTCRMYETHPDPRGGVLSRRCLDQKKDFIFKNEQKGPGRKSAFRNRILIFTSVLYLSLKSFPTLRFRQQRFGLGSRRTGQRLAGWAAASAAP